MNELQQNRYDQLMRRVGGLIGPGAKVAEVLSELFPTLDVERVPGELLALQGTRIGLDSASVIGSAGEFATIQLFNPLDSGNLVTVSQVGISSSANQTVVYGLVSTPIAIKPNTGRPRDSRFTILSPLVAELRNESLGVVAPAVGRMQLPVDDEKYFTDTNALAVLTPGFGFQFAAGTVATRIRVTFFWRERPAQKSELNL